MFRSAEGSVRPLPRDRSPIKPLGDLASGFFVRKGRKESVGCEGRVDLPRAFAQLIYAPRSLLSFAFLASFADKGLSSVTMGRTGSASGMRVGQRAIVVLTGMALAMSALSAGAAPFEGIGRTATEAEIKAWDIDVRPDFAGLPPGSGSVADGEMLWIEKCSSCHGDFGDANHVFPPLIGNTTAQDIETGRAAALKDPGRTRTTIMKVSTVSTLWDFINRAMPWDKPKSLSTDEVYAVLAYLLNLAEVVPADYVLSNENIAWAQSRMPNRNGMTLDHGLWKIRRQAGHPQQGVHEELSRRGRRSRRRFRTSPRPRTASCRSRRANTVRSAARARRRKSRRARLRRRHRRCRTIC